MGNFARPAMVALRLALIDTRKKREVESEAAMD